MEERSKRTVDVVSLGARPATRNHSKNDGQFYNANGDHGAWTRESSEMSGMKRKTALRRPNAIILPSSVFSRAWRFSPKTLDSLMKTITVAAGGWWRLAPRKRVGDEAERGAPASDRDNSSSSSLGRGAVLPAAFAKRRGLAVLRGPRRIVRTCPGPRRLSPPSGPGNTAASLPAPAAQANVRSSLVDPASSHMLVSKIKPCMSQYKPN